MTATLGAPKIQGNGVAKIRFADLVGSRAFLRGWSEIAKGIAFDPCAFAEGVAPETSFSYERGRQAAVFAAAKTGRSLPLRLGGGINPVAFDLAFECLETGAMR